MPTLRMLLCLTLAGLLAGCKLNSGPEARSLRWIPSAAFTAETAGLGKLLAIDPAWTPTLPDRLGARPEEVVGFRLFDEYVFVGEPATGLLRINGRNLPWREYVHFQVWDEPGMNILWEGIARVEPDETYIVQIDPLANASYADQTLQLSIRANAFMINRRVHVLARPGGEPVSDESSSNESAMDGAAFAMPLPPGPVGANDQPLTLIGTPGETIAGALVVWPTQSFDAVVSTFRSRGVAPARGDLRDWSMTLAALDPAKEALTLMPAQGVELAPARAAMFVLNLTIPPGTPAGTYRADWSLHAADRLESLFRRPVTVIVRDVTLEPATPGEPDATQARYLAALRATVRSARSMPSAVRNAADRLEKRIDAAVSYYASRPAGGPADLLLAPDQRFDFKLRWMILDGIDQLQTAGVGPPLVGSGRADRPGP